MAKNTKVSIDRICKTCALYDPTPSIRYACEDFRTPEEWTKEIEDKKKELMRRNEERLNFILTAMMISATSTQMFLEYFDTQFKDRQSESDWRFKRAQAAKEILKATERIRNLYQHNFMEDQTEGTGVCACATSLRPAGRILKQRRTLSDSMRQGRI